MGEFALWPSASEDVLTAARDVLTRLVSQGQVKAVLVMMETQDGLGAQPGLVSGAERLRHANPFLPVLPVHLARMASLLTERDAAPGPGGRVALVARPCELRGAIELAKLKQIDMRQWLMIGVDCIGTYEWADWKRRTGSRPNAFEEHLQATRRAQPQAAEGAYRHACTICETPVAWNADLNLHLIGVEGGLLLEAHDASLLEALGLAPGADAAAHHQQAVEGLRQVRSDARRARLDEMEALLKSDPTGLAGLASLFEACQRCHNCTVVCPICYCKECLFRTDHMRHEPRHYLGLADRRGAARLPGDSVAFQLTRLCHVTASCVGCGLCTSGCPADLPVDALFQAVARRTQALFDYVPGRSLEDPLPPATFERKEFVDLGEPGR
jgi:formate dehydrogenase subunit beta